MGLHGMKNKAQHPAFSRKKYLAIAIPLIMAAQAQGIEFYSGGIEGSFDSEISLGSSWRVEEQDNKLLTTGNSEDGNANFSQGAAFSQVFKGSHDLQLSYKNFGGFVRGKYWYDSALKDNNVDYGHSPTASLGTSATDPFSVNQAGESRLDDSQFNDLAKFSGAQLLDAYVYGEFTLADMPLDVRLGKQVLSWGESTFIFGGINAINPVDINAFTRPGAEIKEGLLPVNMAYANIGLTDNLNAEAFYQLEFQETVLPGCGTYFSTDDFAAQGCNVITIASGALNIQRNTDAIRKPSAHGQFGLAMRFVSEELGDTEFGLYYMNIHSRTPVGNGVKTTADLNQVATDTYVSSVIAAGGDPSAPTADQHAQASAAAEGAAGATLFATTTYFIEYPEDQQLVGLSFATTLGNTAVSGEVNHKIDMPLQINVTQLMTTMLTGSSAIAGLPSSILDSDIAGVALGGTINGYRLFDVSQAQVTAIHFFDRALGSDRLTFVGEVGYTFIHDFKEGDDQIRFGRSDIYDGTGNDGFVTERSWGYRAMLIAEYTDIFAGVNLTPTLAWSHDVKGFAPQPGGAFNEGEQAMNISLAADYLSTYKASISYTQFMGGDFSEVHDRDFAAISVGMQF